MRLESADYIDRCQPQRGEIFVVVGKPKAQPTVNNKMNMDKRWVAMDRSLLQKINGVKKKRKC